MLTIDLKPGKYNPNRIKKYPTPSSYSLNRNKRIRELSRVTQENKMLLQRLQSAQSIYDHTKIPTKKFPKPYFRASNEPRIMSAVGGRTFGYKTMPLKQRRAKSSYAVARRTKKKKKRVMTAGYGGRKRSAVRKGPQAARPITAKGPQIGRRQKTADPEGKQNEEDNGFRPETVPFSNIGPLGATEPQDGDDRIKQEINREVTGESEKEIEARIGEEEEVSKESDNEEKLIEDKFNEKEKQLDNLSDDLSGPDGKDEGQKKDHDKEEDNKEQENLDKNGQGNTEEENQEKELESRPNEAQKQDDAKNTFGNDTEQKESLTPLENEKQDVDQPTPDPQPQATSAPAVEGQDQPPKEGDENSN